MDKNDSSNDGLNFTSSDDNEEQNNANVDDNLSTDPDEVDSDWEDDINEIENFNFDEQSAGVQIDISDEATPYDVFMKIWDEEVMQLILKSSNKYGQKNI